MPVLIAIAIATLLVTLVLWLVASRGSHADPTDVRAEPATVITAAHEHRAFRRFLMARRDPSTATGWLLTTALGVIAGLTLAVGLLLEMVRTNRGVARWDNFAARWGAAHTTGTAERVVKVITQVGSTSVVAVALLTVAVVEYRRLPTRAIPLFFATVMLSELAVNNLIKVLVGRDRPNVARLVQANGFSFPSGHTAAAAAAYAAIALVVGRRRSRRTHALLASVAGGITVAVATSRVLLGAHWLTDVLAGAAVGWTCFALCSIAFGGRLMQFGEPIVQAEAAVAAAVDSPNHVAAPMRGNPS